MEPDWSNIDAVRSWLDSRYPNSNNQTGSPLYRYLKDELAGTQELYRLEGRETHLSVGDGGEFLKFLLRMLETTPCIIELCARQSTRANTTRNTKFRQLLTRTKTIPQSLSHPRSGEEQKKHSSSVREARHTQHQR